ncbi:MAG: HD domain-containing protein [Spirochaetales bacterium]|nr:HD domain-containing protein [Spirochaetales bacterium]
MFYAYRQNSLRKKMAGIPRAVIEIGSTGIRLLVAEITDSSKHNILDRSEQLVNIGRDVFTTGAISRETLLLCIQILTRYKEQLKGWGLTENETIVIGTSAIREAINRDPFVDRVKVKTGYTVRVIDGIEENRLMYIAVTECLKEENAIMRESNSIILEISGGATEMMIMEKGRMIGAHSLRLGSVIIEQNIRSLTRNMEDTRRFIEEFIHNTQKSLASEIDFSKIQQFIAVSGDLKLISLFIGKQVTPFLWEITRKDFETFVDEVMHYSPEECVAKFKINYSETNTFLISLLSYRKFVELTNVQSIIVPDITIREGVILSNSEQQNLNLVTDFNSQIIASAVTLLKKYNGDYNHAKYVKEKSVKIYDALEHELGLNLHARTLLEVSAILHDIGMFIGADNHHIHGKYIVSNSEIFGISMEDRQLIALITGFHKGNKMPQDDEEFNLLPRNSRMIILKLCAILRVADALDRSHQQKINEFSISFASDSITFRVKGHINLALEKLGLAEKGDLFENVFGYKIVLI